MNKALSCRKLIEILQETLQKHGDVPIYFDTEARTFNYHMAKIGSAYFEPEPEKHIGLHESR